MIIKEIYTLAADPVPRVRIATPGGEEHIYSAVCLVQFARDLLQAIQDFEEDKCLPNMFAELKGEL